MIGLEMDRVADALEAVYPELGDRAVQAEVLGMLPRGWPRLAPFEVGRRIEAALLAREAGS